jgi:2'-5' RNA ligase
MSKVYSSAVVIIPPKENWASIQEIRKIYDSNINRWMPHITMLYPFRPRSQFEEVVESFSEICQRIKPFEVLFRKFSYFSQGHQKYTLWLDPEPNQSIINLQAKILKIVPDCNDVNKYKNGFRPHLSVGQIKGKNKILKILPGLQATWEGIKFILNKIYFITRDKSKTSKFRISKQFQFKNE